MKKNVLITGGSGFIGGHLIHLLIANGYAVSILSRRKRADTENISYHIWDVQNQFIDETAILKADYVIHLAGENIAKMRWSKKRKEAIVASRVQSAGLIYTVLKKHGKKLDAFISASAIGIYGTITSEEICTEETAPANDFLGITCQKWEAATDQIGELGMRTVKVRNALVLGENGGLLSMLKPIFKLRLGSALGSGKQYMPWVYVNDLCRIYLEAVKNPDMKGVYNTAVNDNTTNAIFSKTLAKVYGYSIWLPNVPAFLMKMILGEMAATVLTGRRASSAKIKKLGFYFQHENLEDVLRICLSK